MITLARQCRSAETNDPAKLRGRALRAIRAYRRHIRWANRWGERLDAGLLTLEDVDRDGAETLDELHRLEGAAIDAIRAYAKATRQRGPHPCVIDDRGDVFAYVPDLVGEATVEYESVFLVIRTGALSPH